MDRITLRALYIVLGSIGLAIIFNCLFFSKMIGVSLFIFAALLLVAVFLFAKDWQASLTKTWWLVALIAFLSFMPTVRDSEFLTVLNIFATFGLLLFLANELVGKPTRALKLYQYIIAVVVIPIRMLGRALATVSIISQIHSRVQNRDIWLRVFKGILMALPILILFAVLFSQADLAFSQFLQGFVDIRISHRTIQYTVLLVFAFIALLGFLSYIFFQKEISAEQSAAKAEKIIPAGRGIEVMVFLGLISALFLVFIIFQLTYLFGGEVNIVNAGFTYAEYARRGFWELLVVAMISLLLLLAAEKHAGADLKKNVQFMIPALVLVAEVVIVIVSAFKRLSLYIDAYGLTLLRFYVAGIIALLLVLFILLAIKFVKTKCEQFFAFGALISIAGFLVVVNLMNPDAYIIRANIEQFHKTGKVDVVYTQDLSADAMAGKVELYNQLQGEDKETLRQLLLQKKDGLEQSSNVWQSYNISRAKALEHLQGVY